MLTYHLPILCFRAEILILNLPKLIVILAPFPRRTHLSIYLSKPSVISTPFSPRSVFF